MYKAAVIGFGTMGKRHAQVLNWLPETELTAICDPSEEARELARGYSSKVALYETVEELFEKESLDFVVIATHASFHLQPALMAAERGIHVLCEKPIAATLSEADRMISAFEERGLVLAINHQWRLGPGVEKARQMIADGVIGGLLSMHLTFGKGRPAGYELAEMGTHAFDIATCFAGAPLRAMAHIWHGDHRSTPQDIVRSPQLLPGGRDCGLITGSAIAATFQFESGLLMSAEAYQAPDFKDERIAVELRGAKGRLRLVNGKFSDLYHADGVFSVSEEQQIPWRKVETEGFLNEPELSEISNTMVPVYRHMIESIKTGAEHPCNAENARRALEMVYAVYASHFSNAPVAIPLADRTDFLQKISEEGRAYAAG